MKLQDWLERNREHLDTYTIDEKSELAIAAGYDRIAVAQWVTKMKFKGVA